MNPKDHYKQTLHLPQTDFPMKARLPETEPEIIKKWTETEIHKKILEQKKGAKLFFLPDGPPYANGPIHIGHVLGKVLKDMVIKYKNLQNFRAPFLPSFDCHGLPIEMKALRKSSKKTTTNKELRRLCREEASFWVKKQTQSFQRLGILGNWDEPVLTMDPHYEAEETRVFAKLVEKGLIYRGKKPVFWCFKLQTALAFSEAEYREHKSPSIYVCFDLAPKERKKLKWEGPLSAVIWTTTPWTLPANAAICLHPDFEYGIYEGEGRSYLIACELSESFFKEAGTPHLKKQRSFKGRELEGLICLHPFMNRQSPLVLGDHVSLEAGTGLVHTAPGHGLEDHLVGKKYQLPEPCPVDEKGHFTKELPENLRGLFIFKGNKVIVQALKDSGHLISHKEISHSYPYNPRSNSPLIYRLTPQWFFSLDKALPENVSGMPASAPLELDKALPENTSGTPPSLNREKTSQKTSLRSQALKACEKQIHFVPEWGKARLSAMLESSPDWCLSRQRLWGVPLIVFYCRRCETPLLDSQVIEKIAEGMETGGEGIEYYFSRSEKELLPEDLKCSSCGKRDFQKGKDILDVWFDSGIQHAVFLKKGISPPFDLFLEGSDQHRGWFYSSLLSSLALHGVSPFRTLLTHGFVNDIQGDKMSKSKGNVLDPESIVKTGGAEILRLWVAGKNYSLDINPGEESFQRVRESYRRFRNSFRFILGNLHGFQPEKDLMEFKALDAVDQWTLIQLRDLIQSGEKAFEEFAFYKTYQQLNHFFTVPLSAFYLDIIKDRLYTFPKRSPARRKAQTVLYHLIDNLLPFMAPITSFLSEEAYSYLPKKKKESVFLEGFPKPSKEWEQEGIQTLFEKLFPLREELNKQLEDLRRQKKIGSNLQASAKLILEEDFITRALKEREYLEFFGVSQITIEEGGKFSLTVRPAPGEKCLRCWFVSEQLDKRRLCPKCVKNLEQ